MAPSSAHERLKRLREDGVLRGSHADVNPKAMGIGLEALFLIELSYGAIITVRRLIREAWTLYRWDDRPARRP